MALHNYIVDNQLDIMFVTETWLATDPADKIILDQTAPIGYVSHSVPLTTGRGGGVAVIHKESLTCTKQRTQHYSSFDLIEVLLCTKNDSVRVSVVYRPPTGSKHGQPTSLFLEQFHEYMRTCMSSSGHHIAVGF